MQASVSFNTPKPFWLGFRPTGQHQTPHFGERDWDAFTRLGHMPEDIEQMEAPMANMHYQKDLEAILHPNNKFEVEVTPDSVILHNYDFPDPLPNSEGKRKGVCHELAYYLAQALQSTTLKSTQRLLDAYELLVGFGRTANHYFSREGSTHIYLAGWKKGKPKQEARRHALLSKPPFILPEKITRLFPQNAMLLDPSFDKAVHLLSQIPAYWFKGTLYKLSNLPIVGKNLSKAGTLEFQRYNDELSLSDAVPLGFFEDFDTIQYPDWNRAGEWNHPLLLLAFIKNNKNGKVDLELGIQKHPQGKNDYRCYPMENWIDALPEDHALKRFVLKGREDLAKQKVL